MSETREALERTQISDAMAETLHKGNGCEHIEFVTIERAQY
jgi:hypothetical protein